MTKIITRCYDSAEKARLVRHELIEIQKFSPRIVEIHDTAEDLVATLTEAHVQAATATAYEKHVARGGAVVLVRAGYRPLGVAQTTRDVADAMGALDLSDLVEEVYLKEGPEPLSGKILLDHPRLLTRDRVPGSTTYHMADWPIPLISRRKPIRESIIPPHAHMANWPIPLISRRKPADNFAFPRHARMAAFPIPLISRRKARRPFLPSRVTRGWRTGRSRFCPTASPIPAHGSASTRGWPTGPSRCSSMARPGPTRSFRAVPTWQTSRSRF